MSALLENGEMQGGESALVSSSPSPPLLPEELVYAAERGDATAVATALLNPLLTDANMTDEGGFTALLMAVQHRHDSVVKVLLADERVNPNLIHYDGQTALMDAAYYGHASVVRLLLADERVDPNITSLRGGFTALILAADHGHVPVVKLLLADQRTNPNIADENGITTLFHASHGRNASSVLELLLADYRTIRTRPATNGGEHFDAALFNVKYARHARFRGLVRAVVAFRRMRFRAAQAAYAPGGAGFAIAAASFKAGRSALLA